MSSWNLFQPITGGLYSNGLSNCSIGMSLFESIQWEAYEFFEQFHLFQENISCLN